ncbi:hypothetical protein DFH29DRAFT_1029694 [Suillus ampliporus]|nr:hypothetical protein DFH29DRAFT_1029694 [Suillus ampliporus]
MANRSQNGVSRVNHHPDYYLNDGNITFHVQDTLFRVHRHFFETESQFFIREFAKAPKDGSGTSDSSAFILEKVTSDDFAKLLWVWYSKTYRRERKPKDHWLVILELSTTWEFPEMKKLAVDELQNLEIEPLLCKRPSRMSAEEGEQLKMHTVLGIHEARERAIRSAAEGGCLSPTSADADDEELEKILNEVFNLGIRTTNRQGTQPQGQREKVPIINPPKPGPNGGTSNGGAGNGGASNGTGSGGASNGTGNGVPKPFTSPSERDRAILSEESTYDGGSSIELWTGGMETRAERALVHLSIPTFVDASIELEKSLRRNPVGTPLPHVVIENFRTSTGSARTADQQLS